LKDLLGNIQSLKKYILCLPILGSNFFITGILLTLAPEIASATHVMGTVKANIALALYFTVSVIGDGLGAFLSELFKSRRLVAGLFICGNMLLAIFFLQAPHLDIVQFYVLCAGFGIFNLWAISSTIVVEQFPTELRATATTSSFNVSRAMVIVMNVALLTLKPITGTVDGLMIIGGTMFAFGLIGVRYLKETYGRSLANPS
jgi:hypothetical protein